MSDDPFLPGVPSDLVLAAHAASARAIAAAPNPHGWAPARRAAPESPRASATLVANALGWFLPRPGDLPLPAFPEPPGTERPAGDAAAEPVEALSLEAPLRLPWSGGVAWLDALATTGGRLAGIASVRAEAFADRPAAAWPAAFRRDSSWGGAMGGWRSLRDGAADGFAHLDPLRLAREALALRTAAPATGRRPVLLYLWADPRGTPAGARAAHAAEAARMAELTASDEVPLLPLPWTGLLSLWEARGGAEVAAHADLVREEFRL